MKFVNYVAPVKRKRGPNKPKSLTTSPTETKRRSKKGCFCCRRRKKKCDETHPVCKGCARNYLDCVWPETTAKDQYNANSPSFSIEDQLSLVSHYPQESWKIVELSPDPEEYALSPSSVDCSQEFSSLEDEKETITTAGSVALSQGPVQLFNSVPTDSSLFLNEFSTWIPGITLSRDSAYLYHIYVNEFMKSVTPQLSHPKLTPQAVFVPPAAESLILRQVFEVCATAFLSWKIPEYKKISKEKYVECVANIRGEILSGRIDGSEDWLFVAIQSLCLCEKCFGENSSKSARHLTASFRVIQKRQERRRQKRSYKQRSLSVGTKTFLSSVGDCFSANESNIEDSPFEESSVCLSKESCSHTHTDFDEEISPTEKTLIESFVYNYCVALLSCKEQEFNQLPSPFVVFSEFKDIIHQPLFKCAVSWMNSSVIGPANYALELASKASWLSRMSLPLEDGLLSVAEALYTSACNYVAPELPESSKSLVSYNDFNTLKYSINVANGIASASKILLRKVLFNHIKEDDPVIQECVQEVFDNLSSVPNDSYANCIVWWAIAVAACCSTNDIQREFFEERCYDLGRLLHVQICTRVLEFLYDSWGYCNVEGFSGADGKIYSLCEGYGDVKGKGCDILLDREALEKINA